MATAMASYFVIAIARWRMTGPESLVGKRGVVVSRLSPVGEVRLEGVVWRARSVSGDVPEGEPVEVKAVEGIALVVERASVAG